MSSSRRFYLYRNSIPDHLWTEKMIGEISCSSIKQITDLREYLWDNDYLREVSESAIWDKINNVPLRSSDFFIGEEMEIYSRNTIEYLHQIGAGLDEMDFISRLMKSCILNQTIPDLSTIEFLLTGLNLPYNSICSIFTSCSIYSTTQTCQFIIEVLGNIKPYEKSFLMQAISANSKSLVKTLMEFGADIRSHYQFLLETCVEDSSNEVIQFLFDLNLEPIDVQKLFNLSLEKGDILMIRYLIEMGADVRFNRSSALETSYGLGSKPLVKLMLEFGADPNERIERIFSWRNSYNEVLAKILIEAGADPAVSKSFVLMWSCRKGLISMVDYLMGKGWDLSMVSSWTLVEMIHANRIEMFKHLVKIGIDLDRFNDETSTIKDLNDHEYLINDYEYLIKETILWRRPEILQIFIDRGFEPKIEYLKLAVEVQDVGIIKILIEAGTDISEGNYEILTTYEARAEEMKLYSVYWKILEILRGVANRL